MFKRIHLAAAAAALAAAAPGLAQAATVYDAFTSFNGVNGNGHFAYFALTNIPGNTAGMATPADGCPLDSTCLRSVNPVTEAAVYKAAATTPDSIEDDGAILTLPKDQLLASPGDFGVGVAFLAPTAGTYRIKATFTGLSDLATGVTILHPAQPTPQFIGGLNSVPDHLQFRDTVTLAQNQSYVFLIAPGANADYDETGFTFRAIAGVPEPATWAFMIMGFGGAGAMLRRRVAAAI